VAGAHCQGQDIGRAREAPVLAGAGGLSGDAGRAGQHYG